MAVRTPELKLIADHDGDGVRRLSALLCLAITVGALACARSGPAPQAAAVGPRNLLFIVSDALRADALACYGGTARTPNLCALAKRGTLFLRAYSSAPWTLPSAAAMFSGSPASQYALPNRSGSGPLRFHIPAAEKLLAEALAERGYDRLRVVENILATKSNDLQGFGRGPPADRLAAALDPRLAFEDAIVRNRRLILPLRYLVGPSNRPYFVLHWIDDPHAYYSPPSKYLEPLLAESRKLPRPLSFYLRLGHANDPDSGARKLRDVLPDLSPAERAFLHRLYLGEVESVDERVGYLLRALELSGRAADTLVVFTSDHGEGFGEHGSFLHGETLYDELLHVPLIVAGPGVRAGQRLATPVSLVDVMPTLAELLGVDCLESPTGRSFAPLLRGETPAELLDLDQYAVSPLRNEGADALIHGDLKLISTGRDRTLELYDLAADPGEQHDLAAERPRVAAEMLGRVRRIRRHNAERREATLRAVGEPSPREEDEARKQLRALGYVD